MPAGIAILFARVFTALGGLRLISWFHRLIVIGFRFVAQAEVISFFSTVFNTIWGGGLLLWADNNPKLAERAVGFVADEITKHTPIALKLAANTINQITGVNIDTAKISGPSTGEAANQYKIDIGGQFTNVVDQMLNTSAAAQDFQTRTGYVGSQGNLYAYFGTNLDFQLRSLTIGTISSMFGWQSLRHLEGLHQSINWAFGFGWLSWSVLSNAMDVTVNAGMKRHYNALVKPHDLSQAQANKSLIRGYLGHDVWAQIHANAGMRDDARDWQLALEFNQPALATVHTAYDHQLATDAQLDEQMILHELTPQGAEWEKQKIVQGEKWIQEKAVETRKLRHLQAGWESQNDVKARLQGLGMHDNAIPYALEAHASERIFRLRDAVTTEHMKFLRHGWETEDEARQWLVSQNWTEEEIQLAFEANRLELKAQRLPQPKHLTVGELATFAANGLMTPIEAQQYMVGLGYDLKDVNLILGYSILQHAVVQTPRKIRDACETDQHLVNLLTAALSASTVLDPLQILQQSDYFKLVTCYISTLQTGSSGGGTTTVTRPPAPLSLTAAPGSLSVTLNWQPIPILADYQVYRRQIGQGIFIPVGPATTNTTFHDTGLTAGEVYIYIVRSQVNGVESLDSNEVQVQAVA